MIGGNPERNYTIENDMKYKGTTKMLLAQQNT